ncbi:MAG: hypothetical protein KDA96_08265, partial [Planctomycetaceae bacterium]|nr:hypothetical protein [Planctomycetaceae bacterium]
GCRARYFDRQFGKALSPAQLLAVAGLILATLGCLFAIALTNPFGPMSQGTLRQMGRTWSEQLNVARWLLMTGSVFGVVLSLQVPRLTELALRTVTNITWLFVGNALFILLSSLVTASLYLVVVWNIACLALLLWKTNPRRSWTWWERLILWSPYVTIGVLLLVMGEFGDLIFAAGPPVVATVAGSMICRRTKWAEFATWAALFVLGIPIVTIFIGEIPNEYLEPCGLSLSEGRIMLLMLTGGLAWAFFLSFCETPTDNAADGDAAWRQSGEPRSDSHAAS